MLNTEYTPNFTDPRVRSRCLRAIGFVCGVMSKTKPHPWSTRYIDLYLGNQRNDISKWLRQELLICTDEFFKFNTEDRGICKKYILNSAGVDRLRETLKINIYNIYPIVVEVIKQDHSNELAQGKFSYTDKSDRLWHPLQRYRKEHKRRILSEYNFLHHYDIQCCAPTLIYQYSQQIPEVIHNGNWLQGPMDQYLEHIEYYLANKDQVRAELAQELDLPIAAVKEIITALFCGATISRNQYSDIYYIVNKDAAVILFLQQHEFIQNLIKDIKTAWEYIRPIMQKRTKIAPNGKERLCSITCGQRWRVYFNQERRVLDVVRDYLEQHNIKYFLEHDGWSCNQQIDVNLLSDYVRTQLGYKLKFDYELSEIQSDE